MISCVFTWATIANRQYPQNFYAVFIARSPLSRRPCCTNRWIGSAVRNGAGGQLPASTSRRVRADCGTAPAHCVTASLSNPVRYVLGGPLITSSRRPMNWITSELPTTRPVPVQGGHAAAIVSVAGLNPKPGHGSFLLSLIPTVARRVSSRPPNIQGVDFLIAGVASEDRRAVGRDVELTPPANQHTM
jgi:hypothetical protein